MSRFIVQPNMTVYGHGPVWGVVDQTDNNPAIYQPYFCSCLSAAQAERVARALNVADVIEADYPEIAYSIEAGGRDSA